MQTNMISDRKRIPLLIAMLPAGDHRTRQQDWPSAVVRGSRLWQHAASADARRHRIRNPVCGLTRRRG
jgi:hypothetical protein